MALIHLDGTGWGFYCFYCSLFCFCWHARGLGWMGCIIIISFFHFQCCYIYLLKTELFGIREAEVKSEVKVKLKKKRFVSLLPTGKQHPHYFSVFSPPFVFLPLRLCMLHSLFFRLLFLSFCNHRRFFSSDDIVSCLFDRIHHLPRFSFPRKRKAFSTAVPDTHTHRKRERKSLRL